MTSIHTVSRLSRVVLLITVLVGCANEPADEILTDPGMNIRSIAVSDIETRKPEWERSARWIRRGLVDTLKLKNGGIRIVDPAPSMVGDETVIVRGRIESQETLSGLGALGIGLGRAETLAHFSLEDGEGRILTEFDAVSEADDKEIMPVRAMSIDVGARAARVTYSWVREQRRKHKAFIRADRLDDNGSVSVTDPHRPSP